MTLIRMAKISSSITTAEVTTRLDLSQWTVRTQSTIAEMVQGQRVTVTVGKGAQVSTHSLRLYSHRESHSTNCDSLET